MTTRIYLIRHGRTRWNRLRRYCGRLDVPLSREGASQAKRLYRSLNSIVFDRVFCSPQKRALQTARILFGKSGITCLDKLREIDFGVLEGMHYKAIMKKYGRVYKNWISDPYRHRLPGSEPINAFKKRVVSAINGIASKNPGRTVAVICHGGVIAMFVSNLKKAGNFWPYVPKSTSVTVVEYGNGKPKVKKFNDIDHLG